MPCGPNNVWLVKRCGGACPPGAGDKCTLQYCPKGAPQPKPWKTAKGGWRIWRWNEEYRCECLRPGA